MSTFTMAIFDLDGVITDTAKYHYMAWKVLAKRLGFDFTPEHNELLKGVSRWRSLDILLETGGLSDVFSEEEKTRMMDEKNSLYVSYIQKLTSEDILPGAEEILHRLKELGINLGLGSASRNTPLILERLGIAPMFDVIVDGNRTQRPKPDPEVFSLCASDLGIPPEECVVFEDAQAGIDAALAAGMTAVGVGNPENLKGACMWIHGLDELDISLLFNDRTRAMPTAHKFKY